MILLLDCGSSKTSYIEDAVDLYCDYKTIPLLDFEEKDLDNVSGVIISGAPILVTEIDVDIYLSKLSWIRITSLPVFGICFGHQIIGILHGAFASRMREDRDWQEVEVYTQSPLFERLPNTFRMMEDHCETISIPAGFELVASSDACVNEAMQHLSKPIFGVQFHPEVSGNLGTVIIENFIKLATI